MSNKTISINPGLFSLGGSKTKKNRDKKKLPEIKPLISPNVLKNKLLKRIKEHKQRETANLDNNKRKLTEPKEKNNNNIGGNSEDVSKFSDEFSDSLNYLQTLSKQKKVNDEKLNYEKQKQKRREDLERKTVKNFQSISNSISQPMVNIDLPEELKESSININTDSYKPNEEMIKINSNRDTVPYGILKGGTKPTYRDWTKTQRNNIVTNPNAALTIEGSSFNREKSERENRLNNLREKLKLKQLDETIKKQDDLMLTQNLIQKPIISTIVPNIPNININTTQFSESINLDNNININTCKPNEKIIAIKKITKKTIKRKYTLGRSKIKKSVGVLVKDRGTRKKVLNAQKELKNKSINDIKTYLREHNLIKIGSNAPNDVVRKLYESSMLAGEITNSNVETLLHNFSKVEKEL
jgi:hypothetical protein